MLRELEMDESGCLGARANESKQRKETKQEKRIQVVPSRFHGQVRHIQARHWRNSSNMQSRSSKDAYNTFSLT